jgi:Ser/Thr protein kinase RdoA (MazF antagonist)
MLKEILKELFNFDGDITATLLRSYTNDVYLITDSSKRYVLKIYGKEWRSDEEILWELDFTEHLSSKGIPVANVISDKNGNKLNKIVTDDIDNSVVLFEFAYGEKPKPPFSPILQYEVGKAAAKLHTASNSFISIHKRRALDIQYLIDDSLTIAMKILKDNNLRNYKSLAIGLKDRINTLKNEGLDWGPVHGDLTLDNVHVDSDNKITFYDFDSSGFGWRAMELYGWGVLNPELKANVEAYQKGYQEVRKIKPINFTAAPFFQAAQDMWISEGMKVLEDPEILNQQTHRVNAWREYFKNNKLLDIAI